MKILPNQIFGSWQVLELVKGTKTTSSLVLCHCLGCNQTQRLIRKYDLTKGKTKSCGCQSNYYSKQTFISKYGVDSPRRLPETEEKRKATCLKTYGFIHPLQSPEIKNKARNTCLETYGTYYPSQALEVQIKTRNTYLQRYGVENAMHVPDFKAKQIETVKQRYHVENISKSEAIKQQKRETSLKNYNVEYHNQSEEGKKTRKKTNLERFGYENPSQSPEIKEKKRQTTQKNFGVDWPQQSPVVAAKTPNPKYKKVIREHWLTNENLSCTGSYELAVVDYLNKNKINFLWQSQTFQLQTGRTYRPDAYLIDQDKWIEIKGYWRRDSEEKWNEFHTQIHPNSELWTKDTLISKGVLFGSSKTSKSNNRNPEEK
jgi:hypothetical protein